MGVRPTGRHVDEYQVWYLGCIWLFFSHPLNQTPEWEGLCFFVFRNIVHRYISHSGLISSLSILFLFQKHAAGEHGEK